MSYINIPRDRDDPNYRYKMPKLISKIEGRGNGIRTNIANMGDIARSLKRPPMYPTKFFGCELGTMVKFEENEEKAIVNGAHKENDLVNILDKFIDMYVLCPHCLLPETDIIVKKGFLICKCNACGNVGELNNSHKIATYMIKNPPTMSTVGNKKKKKLKEGKEKEKEKNGKSKEKLEKTEDNNSGENNEDVSDNVENEKTKKEKSKKKKEKNKLEENFVLEKESLHFNSPEIKEVIERLKYLISSNPEMSEILFSEELRVLQVSQCFDAKCRIYICLCSLFEDKISKELLEKRINYLKKVNDTSVTTDDIFMAFEHYINHVAISGSLNIYPYLLQILYNNDILESKDILRRYDRVENTLENGKNNKEGGMNEKEMKAEECYQKCKNIAKHFVHWLKDNESDTEEEEESNEKEENSGVDAKENGVTAKNLNNHEKHIKKQQADGNVKREYVESEAENNDNAFKDLKSENGDDEIFLDANDGTNEMGEDEEEIDIDAI